MGQEATACETRGSEFEERNLVHFKVKMSGKGGREATYHGTNQSGNDYTRYNGGGYRYHNYDSQGNSHGHYYETGSGSKFYNSVGRSAEQGGNYRYYENKAGERSYQSTSKK